MIIYNVTINVDEPIHLEWLEWMQKIHLQDVMNTGMFTSYRMLKLLSRQEDELGTTYAIQYSSLNMENYERYQLEFAPKLQADTFKKFGGAFTAFRTLLEEI
ncbi:MAG: DUF4286 family protein [bacterium]|nr:DUF4286 family protein [bacterium]